MSVFRCGICEDLIDGDYNGCHENPFDDCSCICDLCLENIEDDEYKEDVTIPEGFKAEYHPMEKDGVVPNYTTITKNEEKAL